MLTISQNEKYNFPIENYNDITMMEDKICCSETYKIVKCKLLSPVNFLGIIDASLLMCFQVREQASSSVRSQKS